MSVNDILKIMFISCICIYILAHVIIFIKSYVDYKRQERIQRIQFESMMELRKMMFIDKDKGEDEDE